MLRRTKFLPVFVLALLLSCTHGHGQVRESKDEYSHTFSYTPPGDTIARVLSFHRQYNPKTGGHSYAYDDLSFHAEPHYYTLPRRRLTDELPFYDTLLQAALKVVPADSFRYLDVGGPLQWSDILQRQVELFSTHPVWKAKNVKTTPENIAYQLTDTIMVDGHVYRAAEDWIARYGYRISGMQCSKIGYFGPKLLKKEGIDYAGKPMIPVPYEFGIDLRRIDTR